MRASHETAIIHSDSAFSLFASQRCKLFFTRAIIEWTFEFAAILNMENSFKLKAIKDSQMAIERLHGFKYKRAKKVPYGGPEFNLRAQALLQRAKEAATPLLNLIDSEGQHHQQRQNRGQMLPAMSVVVREMVALVLQ